MFAIFFFFFQIIINIKHFCCCNIKEKNKFHLLVHDSAKCIFRVTHSRGSSLCTCTYIHGYVNIDYVTYHKIGGRR